MLEGLSEQGERRTTLFLIVLSFIVGRVEVEVEVEVSSGGGSSGAVGSTFLHLRNKTAAPTSGC